jgi:pimeloyl-ACP methyl ester carboxylesterase
MDSADAEGHERAAMSTFLLVHGAWHGSWCWAKVQFLLQSAGHNVVTLDLPGRAGDTSPAATLTLERYARRVVEVAALQPEPVVAVGHSMGGIVISQAAEHRPDLFRRLVYLAAFLPVDGKSLLELAEDEITLIRANLQPGVPEEGYLWFQPGAPFRDIFYHDCADDDVRRAEALLVPESALVSSTPLRLSADRFGRVPRAYIECRDDHAVSIALQRRMHAAVPCAAVHTLPTSHSPFLSAPGDLVEVILATA